MYNGNKITFDNLNESTKQKFVNLENQVAEKADVNDVKIVSDNLNTLQSEVTEQLAQMETKVENSWQRNKENYVVVSNLGNFTAEKALIINQADWKNTGNVEQLDIGIPVDGGFSGLIKVTYTSFWGGSDSHGGATVLYKIGNYLAPTSATRLNDCVVESITSDFAKDFYIHKAVANTENGNIALLISRSPAANNPLVIKIELQGYNSGSKRAFQILNDIVINVNDMGSPTALGYPWALQKPSGMSRAGDTMTGDLVIEKGIPNLYLRTPNKQHEAIFRLNASNENDFGLDLYRNGAVASRVDKNGYTFVKGLDGVLFNLADLKSFASDVKTNVAAAITEQGVPTSPTATGAQMATNIRAIPKGRKEASGIAYATNVSGRARLVITGLSFNPTAIFITKENNNNNEFKSIWAPSNVFFGNNANAYMNFFTYNETGSILVASPAFVSNYLGFEMTVSMTYNSRSEGAYRWFAFG